MKFDKIGEDGLIRFKSNLAPDVKEPQSTKFWAAGFSFSFGTLIKDCPYTSEFEYLFFGEEQLQAYKMWKKGYQVYSPSVNVCAHLWERSERQFTFVTNKEQTEKRNNAVQKVREILEGDNDYQTYFNNS